jgi:outer membrane protein TolC
MPSTSLRAALRTRVAAAALALGAAAPGAFAEPRLSLDDALQRAEQRSLRLEAQDSAAAAARDLAIAAGRLPDPMLSAGIVNLPIDGPDAYSLTRDFMTMRSIGLKQEFTRAGKRAARAARFEGQADSAEAERLLALTELRRDTALAWFERHYAERLVELLKMQRDETALQIDAAEAAYRGGRGAQADVFAARSAVAQIDDRIRLADLRAATALTRLQRWVGVQAPQARAEPPPLRLDARSLIAALLGRHPQLTLLARQEAAARAEAEVARSDKLADFSVELMYSQRGPAYSNMATLNVSVPLQWDADNRQDRVLAARLALAEQLRAQREETQRELLAETETWLQQWHTDGERLAFYDHTLIPLAGERSRAALAAYRGGNGVLAMVLDARRLEIDVRIERLQLQMQHAALWARIGLLLPPDSAGGVIHKEATR